MRSTFEQLLLRSHSTNANDEPDTNSPAPLEIWKEACFRGRGSTSTNHRLDGLKQTSQQTTYLQAASHKDYSGTCSGGAHGAPIRRSFERREVDPHQAGGCADKRHCWWSEGYGVQGRAYGEWAIWLARSSAPDWRAAISR